MCTNITHQLQIDGSAKAAGSWTRIANAQVSFDHPFHAAFDHTLNLDLLDGDGRRVVALELDEVTARRLLAEIGAVLDDVDSTNAAPAGAASSVDE